MSIARSRAAVICLGGWGLQTMLHLWPRLRGTQEVRRSLDPGGRLADLSRMSAFVAIMPEVVAPQLITLNPASFYRPFRLLRPDPDFFPDSFYVEGLLRDVAEQATANEFPQRSYSERVAAYLLQRAEQSEHPYLREVTLGPPALQHLPPAGTRLGRQDMFLQGASWAESVARSLLHYIIEPTRLDELEPADPYVQTSVYVVASLSEPLTSPLIWPLLLELVALLGNRHQINVVGLFATGSFAADDPTRPFEEAAAHAALCELLTLSGDQSRATEVTALADVLESINLAGWRERMGREKQKLFDRIYLLDREKSNLAIARDSFELAVLAGNAIEAFLTADAGYFVDQALGAEAMNGSAGPFSLLGAANRYVPLVQYLQAALLEEQKRIVRETVLHEDADTARASLAELGADLDSAILGLLQPGSDQIFSPEPVRSQLGRWLRRRAGAAGLAVPGLTGLLPELNVAQNYLFPPASMHELRQRSQLWSWRLAAEALAGHALNRLPADLQTDRFEAAWGGEYSTPAARPGSSIELLALARQQTWAERHGHDRRVLPAATSRALFLLTSQISATPDGLSRARARTAGWVTAVEAVREALGVRDADAEVNAWEEADQRDYRLWQREFARVAAEQAHDAATLVRGLLGALFLTYLVFTWLITIPRAPLPASAYIGAALVCVCVFGLLAGGALLYSRARVNWIKERRIDLARQRAAHLANHLLRNSLLRIFQHLHEDLSLLRQPLEQAVQELRDWSAPIDPPPIPPDYAQPAFLRTALTRETIWRQISTRLRGRRNSAGQESGAAFVARWQADGFELRQWDRIGPQLAQRVRLALELHLNEREMRRPFGLAELEARQRLQVARAPAQLLRPATSLAQARQEVAADLAHGVWCGFASGLEPNHLNPERRPTCTACPDLRRYRCPLSNAGRWQRRDWGLPGLVRSYAHAATEYLRPLRQGLLGQGDFMQRLVDDYALERLIYVDAAGQDGRTGQVPGAEIGFVEDIFASAKPAGMYELFSGLPSNGLDVSFVVTENANRSRMQTVFKQRRLSLLTSHDPLSLSVVRTVNGLASGELALSERSRREYRRLHPDDRRRLVLLDQAGDQERLYGKLDLSLVSYSRIFD